ncbi:hypothetical protein [Chryseobacterium sp. C3]|uniref:hypothetical protein n=1 Tax=Chryseobacterium sp. C3 TaxID=2761532 RepID=UPI001626AD9C|nr:hypothetical protein [Chryseobacterium sp. C3]
MKNIFLVLLLSSNYLLSQKTFFNDKNEMITQKEFDMWQEKQGNFKAYNDSLQFAKIVKTRLKKGKIETDKIISDLQKSLKISINKNNPTVIIYYPGKDPCNSSGIATQEERSLAYKMTEKLVNEITTSKVLYLYKNNEGLENMTKVKWQKDPQGLIENIFFNYHYPCSSYVILYKGSYRSYFGEFPIEFLLSDLRKILKY